jgi:hypothetical protein
MVIIKSISGIDIEISISNTAKNLCAAEVFKSMDADDYSNGP